MKNCVLRRPYCPQPPRGFCPVPSPERPWLEMPPTDELHCLNLNISVPTEPNSCSDGCPLLPVMVFIHGGAFTYSTASSPVYNGRMIAANSASPALSRPTIIVTLHCGSRLGQQNVVSTRLYQIKRILRNTQKAFLPTGNIQKGQFLILMHGYCKQLVSLRWRKNNAFFPLELASSRGLSGILLNHI